MECYWIYYYWKECIIQGDNFEEQFYFAIKSQWKVYLYISLVIKSS